jgi:transcriptional regulator with XRE-family HTH domain
VATVGDVEAAVGGNIGRLRRLRDKMTGKQLSERLKDLGLPLSVATISEVERAKRRVSVNELLVFAIALNASVIDLVTPLNGESLTVTDELTPIPPDALFHWLRGDQAWPGADPDEFRDAATAPTQRLMSVFHSMQLEELSTLAGNILLATQSDVRHGIQLAGVTPRMIADTLRANLDGVTRAVNELIANLESPKADSSGG